MKSALMETEGTKEPQIKISLGCGEGTCRFQERFVLDDMMLMNIMLHLKNCRLYS